MFNNNNNPANKRIYLSSPTMHGEEIEFVREAYETNWVSTVGKNIDIVEEECAKRIGVKYAVGLSCGTSAIHLAVKLAGVKKGDYVFCSDMTFSATVNPVSYEGGKQVFIDSETDTWNMDPDALEVAFDLFPKTKVVIVAHLYGTPGKIERIRDICKKHNAILIEDAAESFGATYNGIQTGSFGDYNIISFNGNKIITGSCGGMLLTNDENAAYTARKLSTQARDNASWYQHTMIGYNYRLSNVVAGFIRGQLPYLDMHIKQKKDIYEKYKSGFETLPLKMNPFEKCSAPNFWLSCILIDKDSMCKQIRTDNNAAFIPEHGKTCPTEILNVLSDNNIEGRPIWKPMHMQPVYSNNPFVTKFGIYVKNQSSDFKPVDEDIFERGLCLPSDNKMSDDEQKKVIQLVSDCFK